MTSLELHTKNKIQKTKFFHEKSLQYLSTVRLKKKKIHSL